jgi:hypothetical protein
MLEDERPIRVVNDDAAGYTLACVGTDGVTGIVAYGEPGPHCDMPWIAVYKGDQIVTRRDASGLSIHYDCVDAQGDSK